MADNVTLNSGSGGDSVAADDIGGVKYPRSKIVIGADGTNDGDVSSANPLPIEGTVDLGATDNAVLDAIAASLAGTLTVGSHAVTNAGTFAVQADTELPTAAALADGAANPTTPLVGSCVLGFNGTTWDRVHASLVNGDAIDTPNSTHFALDAMCHNYAFNGTSWDRFRGDATNGLLVNLGANNDVIVTNAGTFAVQAAQSGTWTVDLGATDNAVLDSIAALLGTIDTDTGGIATSAATIAGAVSGTEMQVDIVSGSVTANAGTNLNTSLLALESGGNLAAAATSLATIDNCISGSEAQVDVVTMPAIAATASNIGAKHATDAIMDGTTALTPKFAVIDAASSGDNTILAAVTSKKIRVLALVLVAAGAVNVRFESGASGTALTGQMNLTTNSGFTLPFNPVGWFETASNTLLNLELSGATSVDGCLTYVEV